MTIARRSRTTLQRIGPLLLLLGCSSGDTVSFESGAVVLDLRTVAFEILRVHGSVGTGASGVPVAGGHDCDGDGLRDFAFAALRADASGRASAGVVFLVFGDGTSVGVRDTAVADVRILRVLGAAQSENAGSEIWMDDVTGDGVGDLLVARQNHTPEPGRIGAGALTIIVGGPHLATLAAADTPIDLAAPPATVPVFTLVGSGTFFRLGIWMRTGDVDGDGVADLVVGEDQRSELGENRRGGVYVVRGGPHLAVTALVDLANFGATALQGHIARITPPPGSAEAHFGATCQIADLDGNGRAEVLAASALNRAGATLLADGAPAGSARGSGGTPDGTLYIAWDDNFPAGLWPAGLAFAISDSPGTRTIIDGGPGNRSFGEEILGGLDYDGDGTPDLFVGDIIGDTTGLRGNAGTGHVFFDAAALRGLEFDLAAPPPGLRITTIQGAAAGDIAGDTAAHGDLDGDGRAELVIASPHGSPQGRFHAGAAHVLFGRGGAWPAFIDLRSIQVSAALEIVEIQGVLGERGADRGDTLGYSAAAGDIDGDGFVDVVINEMVGNGVLPGTEDVGNVLVLSGALIARALAE